MKRRRVRDSKSSRSATSPVPTLGRPSRSPPPPPPPSRTPRREGSIPPWGPGRGGDPLRQHRRRFSASPHQEGQERSDPEGHPIDSSQEFRPPCSLGHRRMTTPPLHHPPPLPPGGTWPGATPPATSGPSALPPPSPPGGGGQLRQNLTNRPRREPPVPSLGAQRQPPEAGPPRPHRSADGPPLGADGHAVGGVLHVAPHIHRTVSSASSAPHTETGSKGVGPQPHLPGPVMRVFHSSPPDPVTPCLLRPSRAGEAGG